MLICGAVFVVQMNSFKALRLVCLITAAWGLTCPVQAQAVKSDAEPILEGDAVIELIQADSFEGWLVPSDCWSIEDGVIIGDTGPDPLNAPEWLYTTQRFADFVFSCEVQLTGSRNPNSGIYYRVNPIQYRWKNGGPTYEAAAGYEFDVAHGKFNGSLGDWYARPKLRIWPDAELMTRVYQQNAWNRLTIRARGQHLEYWVNGTKIIDYIDQDPEGSTEGIIGLQIHNNSIMRIAFRKARIRPL